MAEAEFKPGSRWQFFCTFRKDWISCTAEEDQSLKNGYLVCSEEAPVHRYSLNGMKMKADFSRMLRINQASERSFDLKLIGGRLPFPPPGPAAQKMRGRKKYTAAVEKAPEEKAVEQVEESPHEKAPREGQGAIGHLAEATSLAIEKAKDTTRLPSEQAAPVKEDTGDTFDFVPSPSGKFEFTLSYEDKDDWGKVFIYKTLEAGADLRSLDPRYLVVTDKRGRSTTRNREEMREMFEVARSYPIKVTYDPPDRLHSSLWTDGERTEWELNSLLMYYIKASIRGPGAVTSLDEIKYRHHKCVFERYQLYVGEEEFWNTDRPLDEAEFFLKFPQMAPAVSLAIKVGPRLRDILRGKEEILNMLFGG